MHSPLVGPSTWSPTAEVRRIGFRCAVPDMTRVAAAGAVLPEVRRRPRMFSRAAAIPSCWSDTAAPGHCYRDRRCRRRPNAGRRFRGCDASHPALSWFDTAPPALRRELLGMVSSGLLPPWHRWFPPGVIEELVPQLALRREFVAEIPRLPVAYFEAGAGDACVGDPPVCISAVERRLRSRGRRSRTPWLLGGPQGLDHLRMLTAPESVAELVVQTVDTLQAG